MKSFSLKNLSKDQLEHIIDGYYSAKKSFTINGDKYYFGNPMSFKIYENERELSDAMLVDAIKSKNDYDEDIFGKIIFNDNLFARVAHDVTAENIGDIGYGEGLNSSPLFSDSTSEKYIAEERIIGLSMLKSEIFDFSKLIQLCKEVNSNYQLGNYYALGMLIRTITNHIPPIFGFPTFTEVANNYNGGKSFKGNMTNLSNSMKHIADGFLHEQIRKSEDLVTKEQVQFRADIDRLLEELIRLVKS